MSKFYITTPIYYVNDKPHLGHAYTTVAADVLARFNKLQGKNTFFLVGTDEHGLKIQNKAEEIGKEPQVFADEITAEFKKLWKDLNIEYSNFIRTSDEKHKEAVKKVSQTLYDKGAIYRGFYEGLYCVGCEQFLNESDLVDGKCPDHNTAPEKIKEECYLLKMTEMQNQLIGKIESDEFKIAPEKYKKEILSFLKNQELHDISISRKNVKWGIPLPFDAEHTSYVWFDAFLNYLTGLGWDGEIPLSPPLEKGEIEGDLKFWPPEVQLIGKDILRVHATIWPVILLHLGIPLPKLLFTHGHIISGGKKMSKTLGNTISPQDLIEKFGVDGTRYLLLNAGTFGEDVDMTMERMTEKYNADLANRLGNLTSRVMKLGSMHGFEWKGIDSMNKEFSNLINSLELDKALEYIWDKVREDNLYIEQNKPWELAKIDLGKFSDVMQKLFIDLNMIAEHLQPFLPDTSRKIKEALKDKTVESLFQRIK